MPERQNLPNPDYHAHPQTAHEGRDRPDEAEGYPFTLDDEE
jgi:hypothetical protein